jgi:bacterioferritin (cytochrome b1)
MVMLRSLQEFIDETRTLYDCGRYRSFPPQRAAAVVEVAPEPSARAKAAIEILGRQFAAEVESIVRLRRHAETARYSQFREQLASIASQEQRHAQALVRRIHELGGKVAKVAVDGVTNTSGWQALADDREREIRCCDELVEALALSKDLDAETAELLESILSDERLHLQAISDMQLRTDPQAAP